jgi:tripartite-type tricarboxylate transporter receptor subunit TctC
MVTRRALVRAAGGAAGLIAAPRVLRAAFPERVVRLMIGFAPGGTVDTVARILAQAMSPLIGQQVIIENRPGASASLAASVVVRGPADGYTLLYGVFSHAVAPALVRLPYDTLADLVAVSQVASVPLLLFAAGTAPFRSVNDVVTVARAKPGMVTYASGGAGSSAHLAAELFARRAGIELVHVPYRGSGGAVQSLLAGDVNLLWDTPNPATRAYVDEGQLRALAVMATKRLPSYPDVPAIGELGFGNGLEVQAWQGVLVRSGTPPDVIAILHDAIARAMAMAQTQERVRILAVEPMATEPAAFQDFFRAEVARWSEVARSAGITVQ